MNSYQRANLVAAAIAAFVAGALLLGVLIVGIPEAQEPSRNAPAPPTNEEPSFANQPVGAPVPPCAPEPDASIASAPVPVAAIRPLARVGAGAGGELTYHPGLQSLLVHARDAAERATAVTLFGDPAGTVRVPEPGAMLAGTLPIGGSSMFIGFTESTPHLTLLSDWSVSGREAAEPVHIDLRGLELGSVSSLAVHADEGRVYLVDAGRRVVRLQLPDDLADADAASAPVGACEVPAPPNARFRAVAVRQGDGHLFVLAGGGPADLLEYDARGRYVAAHELGAELPARPRALAFGPSRVPGDRDAHEHLYLLTAERNGRRAIMEVAFDPAPPAEPRTVRSVLVRSTRTDIWTPPSADPTGIGWDPARDTLVVTDSEVDETATYRDVNVWSIDRSGDVTGTGLGRSHEPTDITVTHDGRLYFVTDDGDPSVQVVEVGIDELFGTLDDRVAILSTADFGCQDPEGISYGQRSLFIADGAGTRIYRLTAGPNGVFDGVAPAGDDEAFSFDVGRLGVTDPEGVAYDQVRGTLYILDREQGAPIRETTTDGRLIRTIRLGGLGLRSPSGLTIGPSSDDPALRSLYIVDRGVDNAAAGDGQHDGLLAEIRPAAG